MAVVGARPEVLAQFHQEYIARMERLGIHVEVDAKGTPLPVSVFDLSTLSESARQRIVQAREKDPRKVFLLKGVKR